MDLIQGLFYGLVIIGSFSVGYGVLRAAFPAKQALKASKKLVQSYALGIAIFGPGIVLAVLISDPVFFVVSGILFAVAFLFALAKRKMNDEKDNVTLVVEKKTPEKIPQMVLTKEEKENTVAQKIEAQKELKGEAVNVTSTGTIKAQLFKEKEGNLVVNELKKKTSDIEKKDAEREKKEALAKLRNYATQITQQTAGAEGISEDKKKKKQMGEEIDVGELQRIGNETE